MISFWRGPNCLEWSTSLPTAEFWRGHKAFDARRSACFAVDAGIPRLTRGRLALQLPTVLRESPVLVLPSRVSRMHEESHGAAVDGLWFAKTLADCEINHIAALPHCSVITPSHVSIYGHVPRNAGSPVARPSEPLTRESGAPSTTRRPETSASAAKTRPPRQVLLGRCSPILVRMATIPHCGHAGNRGALAQGRIPFVLEVDLEGQEARGETADVEGGSGIDLPNGR
jgi:hypothetical protein